MSPACLLRLGQTVGKRLNKLPCRIAALRRFSASAPPPLCIARARRSVGGRADGAFATRRGSWRTNVFERLVQLLELLDAGLDALPHVKMQREER